jgi:hypothetical protein
VTTPIDVRTAVVHEPNSVACDLPAHWHPFATSLSRTLAQLVEDQFLILVCKGSSRFVQFAMQHKGMRIEAASNHFLMGRDALGVKQIAALRRLGWHSPTGTPEQATPELDPDGSCNFFIDVPLPLDFPQLAALAVKTVSTVMDVPHDGYLAYNAFGITGGDVSFPGLGVKREINDPDLRMGELADRLLEVLKEATSQTTLDFDEDGDIAVGEGEQQCLVCLVGRPPIVRFYLPLLDCSEPSKTLLERLNELNAHGGPVRHLWTNNCVYAVLDIPAWPLQAQHVELGLALFTDTANKSALWLQSEFGGVPSANQSSASH